MTRRYPPSMSSIWRWTTSLTRSPAEYPARKAVRCLSSGVAAKIASISERERTSGRRYACLGHGIPATTSGLSSVTW